MSDLFLDLIPDPTIDTEPQSMNIQPTETHTKKRILIETHGNTQEEIDIITTAFRTHSHINLVTPGYKTAIWMS